MVSRRRVLRWVLCLVQVLVAGSGARAEWCLEHATDPERVASVAGVSTCRHADDHDHDSADTPSADTSSVPTSSVPTSSADEAEAESATATWAPPGPAGEDAHLHVVSGISADGLAAPFVGPPPALVATPTRWSVHEDLSTLSVSLRPPPATSSSTQTFTVVLRL